MIKNPKILEKFESDLSEKELLNIHESFKIFEDLYKEAISLNVLPSKNPIEGIDTKIKIAKILNACSKSF